MYAFGLKAPANEPNEWGVMQKGGWIRNGNDWNYADSWGVLQTGWLTVNSTRYYMNPSSGRMVRGWLRIDGSFYHFSSSGALDTGWKKIDGSWYYLNSNGRMQTGWLTAGGKTYYFDGNGVMQTGWKRIGGKDYYFDSNGVLQESKGGDGGGGESGGTGDLKWYTKNSELHLSGSGSLSKSVFTSLSYTEYGETRYPWSGSSSTLVIDSGITDIYKFNVTVGNSAVSWGSATGCSKIIVPRSVTYIQSGALDAFAMDGIYGYRGSEAESFAKREEIQFYALD